MNREFGGPGLDVVEPPVRPEVDPVRDMAPAKKKDFLSTEAWQASLDQAKLIQQQQKASAREKKDFLLPIDVRKKIIKLVGDLAKNLGPLDMEDINRALDSMEDEARRNALRELKELHTLASTRSGLSVADGRRQLYEILNMVTPAF